MDVSFKELQLNMDIVLKSQVIYKKPNLETVHIETNETIVKGDIYISILLPKVKLPKTIGPKRCYHH